MVNINHTCLAYGIADNKCLTTHHFSGAPQAVAKRIKSLGITFQQGVEEFDGDTKWAYHGKTLQGPSDGCVSKNHEKAMGSGMPTGCIPMLTRGTVGVYAETRGSAHELLNLLFEANSHDFAPQWL